MEVGDKITLRCQKDKAAITPLQNRHGTTNEAISFIGWPYFLRQNTSNHCKRKYKSEANRADNQSNGPQGPQE
jgi:hypothetical protein